MSVFRVGFTGDIVATDGGQSVSRSVLAVARGEVPEHVLDRDVLDRSDVRTRLAARAVPS